MNTIEIGRIAYDYCLLASKRIRTKDGIKPLCDAGFYPVNATVELCVAIEKRGGNPTTEELISVFNTLITWEEGMRKAASKRPLLERMEIMAGTKLLAIKRKLKAEEE